MGRVGVSFVGNTVTNVFRTPDQKQEKRSLIQTKNAARIVETLGNLKGVPMKIGQMLSLHEGLLPPEITSILSSLQQKAPSVPFVSIRGMMKKELGTRFELIDHIEPYAYAAASIGQIHKAILKDGREVVFKVQYPGIDKVIKADMKNLKGTLQMIFSMFTGLNLTPVWEELNDRLIEELDYEIEADNMERMAKLYNDDQNIIIADVIHELSSRHVLCMSFVKGISPEQACSDEFSQDLKDVWGKRLFGFIASNLLEHHYVHADPNMANFAFRENGAIIVYDFGCVKDVPATLVNGYKRLAKSAFAKKIEEIPEILYGMGVHKVNDEFVPDRIVADYAPVLSEPFRKEPPYTFGEDKVIYEKMFELGSIHWHESLELVFPKDIVFIDRAIFGHLGNLRKLKATGPWREMVEQYKM